MSHIDGLKILIEEKIAGLTTTKDEKFLDIFYSSLERDIKEWYPELNEDAIEYNSWFYSREWGLIIPWSGMHESLISTFFTLSRIKEIKIRDGGSVIYDHILRGCGSRADTKEWLKTGGNVTSPTLIHPPVAVCNEAKLTPDEYDTISKNHNIRTYGECFR